MNKSQRHQAILARDIMDLARDNASNPDILEYASSICWELFMLFGNQEQKVIEWDIISAAYEQQYIALRAGKIKNLSDVDKIYSKALRIIENHH